MDRSDRVNIAGVIGRVPWRRWLGHRIRELGVHTRRLAAARRGPRLVIFPCGTRKLGSSLLRGWYLGEALIPLGWRVTVVPPQLELVQRRRIVRHERPDLILLQKGRHPLNRPGYYPGIPSVFDLDDADYLDPEEHDQVVACVRHSQAVIAGSRAVAEWCRPYNAHTSVIWTGAPAPGRPGASSGSRGRTVAWAHASPLSYPADAAFLQQVLRRVVSRSPGFEFRLYGVDRPDEARHFLEPIRALGIRTRVLPYLKYDSYLESLRDVAVGLHPVNRDDAYSGGKSFGKVLAYLSSGVAVVTSNANDHAEFFRHGENGMMPETVEQWADSISVLLDDRKLRERVVSAAETDFHRRLTIEAAAARTDPVLRQALDRWQSRSGRQEESAEGARRMEQADSVRDEIGHSP